MLAIATGLCFNVDSATTALLLHVVQYNYSSMILRRGTDTMIGAFGALGHGEYGECSKSFAFLVSFNAQVRGLLLLSKQYDARS